MSTACTNYEEAAALSVLLPWLLALCLRQQCQNLRRRHMPKLHRNWLCGRCAWSSGWLLLHGCWPTRLQGSICRASVALHFLILQQRLQLQLV